MEELSQIETILLKAKKREEEEEEELQRLVGLLATGAQTQRDILECMVDVVSNHWTIDDMLLISFALDQGEPIDRIKRYLARFEGRTEKETDRLCEVFKTELSKMEHGIRFGSVDGMASEKEGAGVLDNTRSNYLPDPKGPKRKGEKRLKRKRKKSKSSK